MMEAKSTEMIVAESQLQLIKLLIENDRYSEQQKKEMRAFFELTMASIQSDIDREKLMVDALKKMQKEQELEAAERVKNDLDKMVGKMIGKEIVHQDRKTNEVYKVKVRDFASMNNWQLAGSSVEPAQEKVDVN